ncbi:hypothetical protein BH09PLA1_BH09PLA1_30390 [soil metagenome]
MKTFPKLGKPTRHGYRRSKGYIEKDGQFIQKPFWLGRDPVAAMAKVQIIDEQGCLLDERDGKLVWSAEQLVSIERSFAEIDARLAGRVVLVPLTAQAVVPSVSVFPLQQLPTPIPSNGISLHLALDQYSAFVQTRNEIAQKTMEMIAQRIRSLKHHLPDLPLSEIRFAELQQLRSAITARPACRRQADAKVKMPASPISIMTVRNWLSTLGQAFGWFRKTGRWRKPSELESEELNSVFFLAKLERRGLCRNRAEQAQLFSPKPTLTLDELCVYYRIALPVQRLYLLMGTCLGWRQRQIADLRKSDIVSRKGEHYVRFLRTKTGVEGDLWLCPELASLLIPRVALTPAHPENFALLTENSMPLVHLSASGFDTDSIKLSWGRLRRQVEKKGIRSLAFDSLRRFAGQTISNVGDPFLAQVFLAQVPESILEQHYAGRGIGVGIGRTAFEKVQEVQQEVHRMLAPLFASVNTPLTDLVQRVNDGVAAGSDESGVRAA